MPSLSASKPHIETVRRFNRFYTRQIGLLNEGLLNSPFSLTEVRALYELAHRDRTTAADLCKELALDAGYLSRILRGFEKQGLIAKEISAVDARQSLLIDPSGRVLAGPAPWFGRTVGVDTDLVVKPFGWKGRESLIRRFIDPEARFLFVAAPEVAAVAERFAAIPFDIEGVRFSHRGDLCSFDALLDDFTLHTEPLNRMARVIRAADTDRHDLAPQAAGLLALSVGLSRQYRDDLAQLEAGMAVYDALYRWARDGFDEGHDWPAGRRA